MRDTLRRARRVVVKVGSRLLAESPMGRPAAIADELAELRAARKLEALVVSSGAIALGQKRLAIAERPREMPRLQAIAAVGQSLLMQSWERAFGVHALAVGQVLVTHADVSNRQRFLSARHAIAELFALGVVPIVNENDTVAVDEIKFGDNDLIAALLCNLVGAQALLILTDVDGVLGKDGQRLATIRDIDGEAAPVAGGSESAVGTGGMASKVQAARIAARSGVPTLVIPGRRPGALREALAGSDVGTLFVPSDERLKSRKHWIAYGSRPVATLVVDDGAKSALVGQQRSLLPSGIREVRGKFQAGDAVSVADAQGAEFARGLVSYGSDEVERIRGRHSSDIEAILGYKYLDEVIHRDDLVVL